MAKKHDFLTKEFVQFLNQQLTEASLKEEFIEPDGKPTVTVKYKDNTFKMRNIGDILFAWDYVYLSPRKNLIFGFSPEDCQAWQFTEIPLANLDIVFPKFFSIVKEKVFPDNIDVDQLEWLDVLLVLNDKFKQSVNEEKESEKRRQEAAYANNSLFGRF